MKNQIFSTTKHERKSLEHDSTILQQDKVVITHHRISSQLISFPQEKLFNLYKLWTVINSLSLAYNVQLCGKGELTLALVFLLYN